MGTEADDLASGSGDASASEKHIAEILEKQKRREEQEVIRENLRITKYLLH